MKTTLEILDMIEEFSKIKPKKKGNEIILPNPVEFAKKKWYSEEEFKSLFRENQIFIDYINDKNLSNDFLIYIKENQVRENE